MSINNAIFYLSRIFGLAPFSTVTGTNFTLYKFSRCWLCYSIFLTFSMSCCVMPAMHYVLYRIESQSLFYKSSLRVSDAYLVLLLLIQMLTLYNANNVAVMFKHFSYLDNATSYKNEKSNVAKFMVIQLVVIMIETTQFSAGLESVGFYLEKVCCCVFYIFEKSVLWLVDFQFCYLVSMLRQRYAHLNKILELKESPGTDITLNRLQGSNGSTLSNPSSCLHFAEANVSHDVGKYYELLRRLSEFVNSTYFLINILTMTCTVLYITWSSYGIVVATAFPSNDSGSWWKIEETIYNVILWKLEYVGKLITTVTVCAGTCNEVSLNIRAR